MSSEDFLQLTYNEQIELLTAQGLYIGKRGRRPKVSLLFQLDSFYVEISYVKYRLQIASIRCSTCTSILDPYFELMDVPLLVYEFRIS